MRTHWDRLLALLLTFVSLPQRVKLSPETSQSQNFDVSKRSSLRHRLGGPIGNPSAGDYLNNQRRASFSAWAGKRGFNPWSGKRALAEDHGTEYNEEAVKLFTVPSEKGEEKRTFSAWAGKRAFNPWSGKRSQDENQVDEVRKAFISLTEDQGSAPDKRTFSAWAGKRSTDDIDDEGNRELLTMLNSFSDDSVEEVGEKTRLRREFRPWAGKRAARDVDDYEKRDQPRSRKFDPWAGKRAFNPWSGKRAFNPWSGKRAFNPWSGKRAFNPWSGKRAFNPWSGKRAFNPWSGKRAFNPWSGKRAFNPWSGKRSYSDEYIYDNEDKYTVIHMLKNLESELEDTKSSLPSWNSLFKLADSDDVSDYLLTA